MDADPGRELWPITATIERINCLEDRKPRAHSALSGVIECLRPAEIGHHSVAEKFRDMTVETLHRRGGRALIVGVDLAPFLGVEARGNLRRADEVAEQHRQMPSLTFYLLVEFRAGGRGFERGQGSCALRTELRLRSIFTRALGTTLVQRRRTLVAEPPVLSVFGAALRATHCDYLPGRSR